MQFSDKLPNMGRTVVIDNYYTSLELANKLFDNGTHLIGTIRGNSQNVVQKKLKKGEIIAKENERGICIKKWKNHRDIMMLSTKHKDQTVTVNRRQTYRTNN